MKPYVKLAALSALSLAAAVAGHMWETAESAKMAHPGVTSQMIYGTFLVYPALCVFMGFLCGPQCKRLAFFPVIPPLMICFAIPYYFIYFYIPLLYMVLGVVSLTVSGRLCRSLRTKGLGELQVELAVFLICCFGGLALLSVQYSVSNHPLRWKLLSFVFMPLLSALAGYAAARRGDELVLFTLLPPVVILVCFGVAFPQQWLVALVNWLACLAVWKLRLKRTHHV